MHDMIGEYLTRISPSKTGHRISWEVWMPCRGSTLVGAGSALSWDYALRDAREAINRHTAAFFGTELEVVGNDGE